MDQATRNKLQKATQQIRRALESEFSEQLEGTFDILSSGKILPEPGVHLSPAQRLIRQKLVDSITHNQASGKSVSEAIQEYTREAAFTFLNRFVALRMLEARGILLECVSKGDQSSGFKEFTGLAAGLASLPDGGYRLYLECLCDELSVEVKVLFDRRDPAGLLWPRRNALNEILETLGQTDLAAVWKEDETIGWVYQYFNSSEERKQMRDESAAPRNSRELAVRNQFFTPRYVVEFLTDNTLGRIWYEMRQGQTVLKEKCKYLVRRHSEVFLAQGETAPPEQESQQELSQEELLKKTVYIPFRPKKDPRDLKVLDPASGSGHFLLYSFDLLLTIYEEAYDDAELGPALKLDYPTLAEFRHDIPRLILAHNLHGIDIDLRATQIASLALWMRAQRAFQEMKLPVASRPAIRRSNIVCAEPMPGEAHMLDEFANQLNPPVLGQLVRVVFEKMKLAGEAGSLLKIEEEIRDAVETARQQFGSGPVKVQTTFFDVNTPAPRQQQFDLSGVRETEFFEQAEALVLDALRIYAEQAQTSQKTKRRLFAQDAARGFAFIDLCRKRYDVALMNPPFGDWSKKVVKDSKSLYPNSYNDILAAFVERGGNLLRNLGKIGAITSRTGFFLSSFNKWRDEVILSQLQPEIFVDLGHGVMDAAMVEAASYVLEKSTLRKSSYEKIVCVSMISQNERPEKLKSVISKVTEGLNSPFLFLVQSSSFKKVPGAPFAYWISDKIRNLFESKMPFDSDQRAVKQGLATANDFRFLRLFWEIPSADKSCKNWFDFAKGGEFSPYYSEIPLVVNWGKGKQELYEIVDRESGNPKSNIWMLKDTSAKFFLRPAITWPLRTQSFGPRCLPSGCVFGHKGPAAYVNSNDPEELLALLGVMCSSLFYSLIELQLNAADASARSFEVGVIKRTVVPIISDAERIVIAKLSKKAYYVNLNKQSQKLTSRFFMSSIISNRDGGTLCEKLKSSAEYIINLEVVLAKTQAEINSCVSGCYGIEQSELAFQSSKIDSESVDFKKGIVNASDGLTSIENDFCQTIADWIEFNLGVQFGRWDIRYATGEKAAPELPDPFAPLPVCPPGQLQNEQGLPAGPGDVPEGYPVPIPWDGILVDDPNHPDDIVARSRHVMELIWHDKAADIEHEAAEILGVRELRDYFRKSAAGGFWPDHIKRYSKSRRKAPIYWQLATASGTYSVWLYYHRFTSDTFFKILNEYARPKLAHERQKLDRLKGEFGAQPTRSQQKELETQESLIAELAEFTEEIQRVAPLWSPNLNDGVIINFAPLWRLVPQNKPWQKECKACWDSLVKGEYDWSHLAMHLWPERVMPKCQTDASLAIAHGLENEFWQKDARDRYQPKPAPECGWEVVVKKLVAERQSPAVKASVESLMEAPVSQSGGKGGRKRKGTA